MSNIFYSKSLMCLVMFTVFVSTMSRRGFILSRGDSRTYLGFVSGLQKEKALA